MAILDLSETSDRIVVRFDVPGNRINSYALATALVGLSDAIHAANAVVNPGFRVEVVVEATPDGSFQAVLRTIARNVGDLFSKDAYKNILWGILASYLYGLANDPAPQVSVSKDRVIIQVGNDRIIVPLEVAEARKQVERSDAFRAGVGRFFDGASTDPSVAGISVGRCADEEAPGIPRERFAMFREHQLAPEGTREVTEHATLEISRAILEPGQRRWEFYWRGNKISAPVLDRAFFARFASREVTIAPGDSLEVVLRITQQAIPETGIFVNKKYEVIQVLAHNPRGIQGGM